VEKLRQELDRWLEVAWNQGERALDAIGVRQPCKDWLPRIDVVESTEEIRVFVDVPGINPDAIDVTLAGNMLTIHGERTLPHVATGDVAVFQERPRGKFSRSVPLPASVNPERVAAEAKDGVLTITIAKAEACKPRKIQIAGSGGAVHEGMPTNPM
jgi:HSP20 family protein